MRAALLAMAVGLAIASACTGAVLAGEGEGEGEGGQVGEGEGEGTAGLPCSTDDQCQVEWLAGPNPHACTASSECSGARCVPASTGRDLCIGGMSATSATCDQGVTASVVDTEGQSWFFCAPTDATCTAGGACVILPQ